MNRKRNHLCALLALAIAILGFGVSAQAQKAPRRIIFARRATVARASGYLRGVRDEVWFVIRARAGQHMRVEIRGHGPTRGVLYFPSGKQDGGPGGAIYDGDIDESGDYRIRVTESSMANAWRGSFTVTVEILPRGQSTPSVSALESYVGKYPTELLRKVPFMRSSSAARWHKDTLRHIVVSTQLSSSICSAATFRLSLEETMKTLLIMIVS